jgi:regulatory protein
MAERDPLEVAVRALRHRDRSRHEVDQRLAGAGVDDAARAETLDALERIGYLDDARVAHARAEALAARGYGDEWIRHDLGGRGIAADAAADAVAALTPEPERALALVANGNVSPKTAARLARKGFTAETIERLLERGWRDEAPEL